MEPVNRHRLSETLDADRVLSIRIDRLLQQLEPRKCQRRIIFGKQGEGSFGRLQLLLVLAAQEVPHKRAGARGHPPVEQLPRQHTANCCEVGDGGAPSTATTGLLGIELCAVCVSMSEVCYSMTAGRGSCG